jgi:hypothetical protein
MDMAKIEGTEIVIRIPLAALPNAASVAWDDAYGEHDIAVVDLEAFAKDFVLELVREEEDGTTLVHLMLDKAAVKAAENGAFGLSDHRP